MLDLSCSLDGIGREIYSDPVIARTLSAAKNLNSPVILEGCDMPKLVDFGWATSAFGRTRICFTPSRAWCLRVLNSKASKGVSQNSPKQEILPGFDPYLI